jgi:hypothetical protein
VENFRNYACDRAILSEGAATKQRNLLDVLYVIWRGDGCTSRHHSIVAETKEVAESLWLYR